MITKTHVSLRSTDIFRRVGSSIWGLQFILGLLSLFGVLILLAIALARMSRAYTSFGPAAVPAWGQALLTQSVILFIAAVMLLAEYTIRRKYGLLINKEGLTFYRPFFSEVFIPWISVQGIAFAQDQFGNSKKRESRAVLWLDAEQQVSLKRYVHPRDLPGVVTRIKAELYPQLELRYRNTLQGGGYITFGAIALNRYGITLHNHPYTWDQIGKITIDNGQLTVVLRNQRALRQDIIDIPNLEVLISLIRDFERK